MSSLNKHLEYWVSLSFESDEFNDHKNEASECLTMIYSLLSKDMEYTPESSPSFSTKYSLSFQKLIIQMLTHMKTLLPLTDVGIQNLEFLRLPQTKSDFVTGLLNLTTKF